MIVLKEHILFIEAPLTGAGLKGITYAKNEGMYISFLTNNKEKYKNSGILNYVNNLVECDTNSEEIVLETVKEIEKTKHITSVITFADFYVPKVAYVAEYLKLPYMSYKTALNCRNKFFMRDILNKNLSKYNPLYFLVTSVEEAKEKAKLIKYPLIMKPQDENDSYNVVFIKDEQQLVSEFLRITNGDVNRAGQKKFSKSLLLEEYLSFQEYSVETYTVNGKTTLIGVTKKFTDGIERGCFVELAHVFPVEENKNEIFKAVQEIFNELGIDNAVCHTEVKVDSLKKEVKLIEVNPRLAGGGIGSDMIELSTGNSAVKCAVDIARGKEVLDKFIKNKYTVIHKIQSLKEGELKNIIFPNSIENDSYFEKKGLYLPLGTRVRAPKLNADFIGYILVKGEELDKTLEYAKNLIKNIKLEIKE